MRKGENVARPKKCVEEKSSREEAYEAWNGLTHQMTEASISLHLLESAVRKYTYTFNDFEIDRFSKLIEATNRYIEAENDRVNQIYAQRIGLCEERK